MTEKPAFEELERRIRLELDRDGGMSEQAAAAWSGYLAALLEWGLISVSMHARLCDLLPPVKGNPAVDIFLGPPESRG